MLQSKKLSAYADLRHGFTTKQEGDMKVRKSQDFDRIGAILGVPGAEIVGFEQVHGGEIAPVTKNERGQILPQVDGGITKSRDVYLLVNTADCLPLIFYDSRQHITAAIHAGWKGLASGIVSNVAKEFMSLGTKVSEAIVAIGPHINGCCYTVPAERANIFRRLVGDSVVYEVSGVYHLDLTRIAIILLRQSLFSLANIDYFLSCTSCQQNDYYSRRRDGQVYAEMATFIGLKS